MKALKKNVGGDLFYRTCLEMAVPGMGIWEGAGGLTSAVSILEYKFHEDSVIFIFIVA